MLSRIHQIPKNARLGALCAAVALLSFAAIGYLDRSEDASLADAVPARSEAKQDAITKEQLAEALADSATFYKFPTEMDFEIDWDRTGSPHEPAPAKETIRGVIDYAFDPMLQAEVESLFRIYRPDYGAFVAMDAATGQVLALVSFTQRQDNRGNLALRSGFPSASIFKLVTAAAVIEGRNYSANTIIPFNGANHTLYRSNILKTKYTRWTRYATLKDAFAKSINTVFGRIGAFAVEPDELRNYADRFGFNRRISGDLPIEPGRAPIDADPWKRAESASGYTRDTTMSPLQGALMAAAVVNDGVMMEPFIVRNVYTEDGTELYAAKPRMATQSVDPRTAAEIRALMRETVTHGTSRKSFRNFFRGRFAQLDVGGKTGSLTGSDPRGKYDWFVGYADDGTRKIAIASLTIHEKLWRVKSSFVARRAIEVYFRGREVASSE
ncbi:MAG: penicillin-binding transpeptidase domain-containing protein [Oligoflexia bacterium]|nr:penicillin-binding transpeptidase domain-containing protein [Oligoflexia bacterium]